LDGKNNTMNHIKKLILTGTLALSASAWAGDPYQYAAQEGEAFMTRMEQRREAREQRYEMERQADALERQADALESLERSNRCRSVINLDF
jgi:hypothetical protein